MLQQLPRSISTIIGPTGSGKDTQADLLSKHFGYKIIKVGRLVRQAAETNKDIAQSIQKGELANDEFINQLIVDKLTSFSKSDKILLDGFPRHLVQAIWLDELLQKNGLSLHRAIYIDVSDTEVKRRLALRKREDDAPHNIAKRLDIFHHQTDDVITHYRTSGKLVQVDGEGSVDEVFNRIKEHTQ